MDRHRKAMSVGITVKIKRSSGEGVQLSFSETIIFNTSCLSLSLFTLGLVHDASVTGIDSLKGLVSVEWYENGETKGKEVREMDFIYYFFVVFILFFSD